MTELENMRNAWRATADALGKEAASESFAHGMRTGRVQTALDSLRGRYRRFVAVSLMSIVMVWLLVLNPGSPFGGGWIFGAVATVFFLTSASIDYWLMRRVGEIDCVRWPVCDVVARARLCRKRHLQSIVVLIPFAFAVIGVMVWTVGADIYTLYGMCFGGAVGLLAGSLVLRRFLRDYRKINDKA